MLYSREIYPLSTTMRFSGTKPQKRSPHTKTAFLTTAVFVFSVALLGGGALSAQAQGLGLDSSFGANTGLTTTDLASFVGRIIYAFLGLLGIVAIGLIIYAGFIWMTAQGNDEKVKEAKKILTNAVIGLVVIFASYAITAFIIRALMDASAGGGITGGGSANAPSPLLFSNRSGGQLGNGPIEYHYPEPGQGGVPRNTKISITFKRPLVLSTVFRNYNDKGTYTPADDILCSSGSTCASGTAVTPETALQLNMDTVRVIANTALGAGSSGSIDAQFNNRYPVAASVDANVRVTAVTVPATLGQPQTLVIKPLAPLGSATAEVNYRVALRGGDTGVRLWTISPTGGEPTPIAAFNRTFADGGYYWTFTTSTVIDTTPPRIVAVEPVLTNTPGLPTSSVLDRNQLLQVYFDEPIDPTTATGEIGGTGGFANIEVQARCRPNTFNAAGTSNPEACVFNNGQSGTVQGTMTIGNRNQTLEFTPTAACEGVSSNSCGTKVYCLPKNVDLTVRALAATIGSSGPSAVASNGIVDMADNSMDGNGNGTAEGPQAPVQPGGRTGDYYRNNPATDLSTVSDTARWAHVVGSNVDLVPPHIVEMDPPPPPEFSASYPNGPSNVPPLLNPSITWSKTMSIGSIRTGQFEELQGQYNPDTATLFLRSRECAKHNPNESCPNPPTKCDCTNVEPPGFFIDAGKPLTGNNGQSYTKMSFLHPVRPFYTANDLGYTDTEIANYPENIPQYVPIARSQIRDTKQNCFWPSSFVQCTTSATGQTSCCNRTASPDSGFLSNCSP